MLQKYICSFSDVAAWEMKQKNLRTAKQFIIKKKNSFYIIKFIYVIHQVWRRFLQFLSGSGGGSATKVLTQYREQWRPGNWWLWSLSKLHCSAVLFQLWTHFEVCKGSVDNGMPTWPTHFSSYFYLILHQYSLALLEAFYIISLVGLDAFCHIAFHTTDAL